MTAIQNIECVSMEQNFAIPDPACSQPLSELKIGIRRAAFHTAFGSVDGYLRCANIEVSLVPLLRGASSLVTPLWLGGDLGEVLIGGAPAGIASIVIYQDLRPGNKYFRASGCGADNFHGGSIRIDEIFFWGD